MAVQVDPRDLGPQRFVAVLQLLDEGDTVTVDGVFDYDLLHAVIAFQKSQGLARTGRYDSATRVRLGAPVPVRLRYPKAGRAIEIDPASAEARNDFGVFLFRSDQVDRSIEELMEAVRLAPSRARSPPPPPRSVSTP